MYNGGVALSGPACSHLGIVVFFFLFAGGSQCVVKY